jgi:endonuclease G
MCKLLPCQIYLMIFGRMRYAPAKSAILLLMLLIIVLSGCQQSTPPQAVVVPRFSVPHYAERADTVVDMGNYTSHYSYVLKEPLYVSYTLSHGGGDCSRAHYRFKADSTLTANAADYSHSGYDEGHLANAEDFAYDCKLDKKTFSFYNCLPQTPRLNRGIWKVWETRIRALSQTQTLYITAGGIFTSKLIKPGRMAAVPDYCYKVVIDSASRQMVYCLLFPNDETDQVLPIDLETLKGTLGYPLVLPGAK